jgi:hypothetical protein
MLIRHKLLHTKNRISYRHIEHKLPSCENFKKKHMHHGSCSVDLTIKDALLVQAELKKTLYIKIIAF